MGRRGNRAFGCKALKSARMRGALLVTAALCMGPLVKGVAVGNGPGGGAQTPPAGREGEVAKAVPEAGGEEAAELRRELEASQRRIRQLTTLLEGKSATAVPEPEGSSSSGSSAEAEALRAEISEMRTLLLQSLEALQGLARRVEALETNNAVSVPASVAAQTAAAPGDQEQDQRLNELEEQVLDIEERLGSRALANVFDGESLDIGGFLTQSMTLAKGEDSSGASFNQSQFELLLRAELNEDWSFFTALGFLREADLDFSNPRRPFFRSFQNRVPQILAWANWKHSDGFQLQFGRFVTPHGIINIEHFPPVLLETNQPQFLRPFSGASIFPNFTSGIQAHGMVFYGANSLQYHAYTGVFTGGDADDTVLGGRLAYNHFKSGLAYGLNYHYGKRQMGDGPPGHFSIVSGESLTTNHYQVLGADLLLDKGRWLWKNEAYYSFEDGFDDRVAAFTQPAFRVHDKFLLFYRFDYFDPGQGLGDSVEHVFGFNILPRHTIRIRASYFFKDFELRTQEEDSHVLQLSATFSF